ncbi:hypothetical protein Gogos_021331 [Gossypium gossypioides]|uniref:Uncharacterized protein n=1 Tax=Gossypium gossypioides TaxID=34282 RepID=A0A7J9D5H0_GOSGO|nr:hypothetical protein [Gossypium gossypioides]
MDKEAEVNFLEIFHGPSLKAFIIGGGLVLFQEVSLAPRLTILFSVAADATHLSIAVRLFKLLLTWIAVAKVVDIGRRPLLMGGVGGIACNLYPSFQFNRFEPRICWYSFRLLVECVSESIHMLSLSCEEIFSFFSVVSLLFVVLYVPSSEPLLHEKYCNKLWKQ